MKLITILVSTFLLSGCCLVDYTDDIQELARPIQNAVLQFIKIEERTPISVSEKKGILKLVGCKKVIPSHEGSSKTFYCKYSGKRFHITLDDRLTEDLRENNKTDFSYYIRIIKGDYNKESQCKADIDHLGKPEKISCWNLGCLTWSH